MGRFTVHTEEQQAEILAKKLPDGSFWRAKHIPDSTMYKLLYAMGLELLRLEEKLNYTWDELHINDCQDMITDWEKEYGMPGSCFDSAIRSGTLEERINNILVKIAANGTSTAEQFESLAEKMGENIKVYSGGESGLFTFPFVFPIKFLIEDERDSRFIIYIEWQDQSPSTFPFKFPIRFGTIGQAILICFFKKLKPANCKIIYIN
jgi:uncharacterized protein YmfQ (DUF2313 family)